MARESTPHLVGLQDLTPFPNAPRPSLCTKWRPTVYASTKALDLCIRHRLVHPSCPPARQGHWEGNYRHAALRLTPTKTRPQPLFCTIHQSRPQGITFDIPQHRHKMIVLLNRKCFESPLPHMATGPIVAMVPAYMRRQQPLHEPTQVPILPRPEDQMKMIRHQAVGQHPHPHPISPLLQELAERCIVLWLVKHLPASIAPVDDVIADSPDCSPSRAWHGRQSIETWPSHQ